MHKIKKEKVLLLDKIHPVAKTRFEAAGLQVSTADNLPIKNPASMLADTTVLGIRSKTKLTAELLRQAPCLQAIGAFGVGVNQIDISAASEMGVAVFNAPYANTRSVVELTLGQIFALMRQSGDRNREMHNGKWNKKSAGAQEVRGKTLGIVGYGNVGSQLSILAEALGMRVVYYDLAERLAHGNARKCRSLTELLRLADVVTLHVDGGKDNIRIIGKKEIAMMKKGSLLLNISRGMLVDTAALVAALAAEHLAGAAMDAFPDEPSKSLGSFKSPLRNLSNVLLTPHIGGSTEQAQQAIGEYVPDILIDYLSTGSSFGSVNLPNVRLTPVRGTHRMLHIHKNVPGMLARINGIFAENNCNILAQHLKTNELLGYVISDIDKNYGKRLTERLAGAEGTLRFNVIS